MKNILLIALVVSNIVCRAQVTHSTADVKLTLPNGSYKLTKQQVEAIPGIKLSPTLSTSYAPPFAYKSGQIFIGLFNVNKDSINNDLPRKKRFQDESYIFLRSNGNTTYKSFIKSMGQNQVLLTSYTINDTGHYRFYFQNEKRTLTQAGYIDYPIVESEKAAILLNEILNSIEFTK